MGQQCTPACSAEFQKCFNYLVGHSEEEQWIAEGSAYLTCRAEIDTGNPNAKLAKAGCAAGCMDNPQMAELKGGDPED